LLGPSNTEKIRGIESTVAGATGKVSGVVNTVTGLVGGSSSHHVSLASFQHGYEERTPQGIIWRAEPSNSTNGTNATNCTNGTRAHNSTNGRGPHAESLQSVSVAIGTEVSVPVGVVVAKEPSVAVPQAANG
jgi:hypothetical protein